MCLCVCRELKELPLAKNVKKKVFNFFLQTKIIIKNKIYNKKKKRRELKLMGLEKCTYEKEKKKRERECVCVCALKIHLIKMYWQVI